MSSNASFHPQLKDIHFSVIEEERNQRFSLPKKPESENFDFYSYMISY